MFLVIVTASLNVSGSVFHGMDLILSSRFRMSVVRGLKSIGASFCLLPASACAEPVSAIGDVSIANRCLDPPQRWLRAAYCTTPESLILLESTNLGLSESLRGLTSISRVGSIPWTPTGRICPSWFLWQNECSFEVKHWLIQSFARVKHSAEIGSRHIGLPRISFSSDCASIDP